jgi:hypothetical protein
VSFCLDVKLGVSDLGKPCNEVVREQGAAKNVYA